MLKVTIEVWPHGDMERGQFLSLVDISNDGTGEGDVGNYDICMLHRDKEKRFRRRVINFDRERGYHALTALALEALAMPKGSVLDASQDRIAYLERSLEYNIEALAKAEHKLSEKGDK